MDALSSESQSATSPKGHDDRLEPLTGPLVGTLARLPGAATPTVTGSPMDMLLVKIFSTALILSQVTTAPDALKTQFDPLADQAEVVALLREGCTHMRKVFEIEDMNLDDLLATAMADPDLVAGGDTNLSGDQIRRSAECVPAVLHQRPGSQRRF